MYVELLLATVVISTYISVTPSAGSILPNGTLTFVNEALCRYFDTRPEEILNKNFVPMILDDDRQFVNKTIASISFEHPLETHEQIIAAINKAK